MSGDSHQPQCICYGKHACVDTRVFNNFYFKQVLASTTGSIIATVVLNPITVIKVKLQSGSDVTSVGDAVRSVWRSKGISGLWMGMPLGLLMSIPNTVLYMATYESIKAYMKSTYSESWQVFVPGAAGKLRRLKQPTANKLSEWKWWTAIEPFTVMPFVLWLLVLLSLHCYQFVQCRGYSVTIAVRSAVLLMCWLNSKASHTTTSSYPRTTSSYY